ncbi:protein RTE1-HOMOLOG [Herrania umbratica]|uniref:Protein RTE1-HOMOLOG n=1 Tax=Herrania umbratica TaxID=108875 RepID=A0A6J0ZIN9_9ROSI|nr:protein RTE1-HOMOLOG [Herrania umbratica]XP_021274365.1 protein RTE1-HOMOLOG [Herrania umbratica]
MEEHVDSDHQLMVEGGLTFPRSMQIDPRRQRFPCCIVWTPLPVLSWLVPFIGHVGICREDGVILDFAGPNFVCVDNFTFGAVARYIQINKDKECCISPHPSAFKGEPEYQHDDPRRETLTWDDALQKSTQEFQHRSYSLFTCNCHSFVANNLNRLGFHSGGWNVVNLAVLIFLKGCWVSKSAFLRSFLPFVIVSVLGLAFGGTTYLTFLALFAFLLVGWFLLGTYCFKSLIHL